MKFFSKQLFLKIFLSLLITLSIFYLSQSQVYWTSFWNFLNIPAYIPFSDFKALNIFLEYKENGFDPYQKNPNSHPIHSVLIYPSVWLHIFDFLNLKNELNLKISILFVLFTYFYVLIDFVSRINNKLFKYFIIIFFFSTSNFLLIERLNIEIIVFCLVYFALINKYFFIQLIFYTLSLILKIFPIFSIFMFIEKKRIFLIVLIFSIAYILLMRNEIVLIKNNVIEYALIFAYGVLSISKAIYFYSIKFNFFINDNNYFIFKNLMILAVSSIATIIVLSNFRFNVKKKIEQISNEEKMFLSGAGVYIGTFLTSANIDYRLIFLLLTLPYILNTERNTLKVIYLICISICFNSLIFEGGDSYSLSYFIKASIIYLLKFAILFINCVIFGEVCNKFININMNFIKNK